MNSPQNLYLAAKAAKTSKVFRNVSDAANDPHYVVGVVRQGLPKKLWPDPAAANESSRSVGQRLCAHLNAALCAFSRVAANMGRCT